QRRLIGARCEVAIERVVAQVGASADEPACERRPAVVEHLLERGLPVDERRLLAPEGVAIDQGAAVVLAVGRHAGISSSRGAGSVPVPFTPAYSSRQRARGRSNALLGLAPQGRGAAAFR